MKKLFNFFLLSFGFFLGGCSLTTTTTVTTTEPVVSDPLAIWSIQDLLSLAADQDATLMADLDLTGIEWTPLFSHDTPYSGSFDGNNHTIANLSISTRNTDFVGLFAHISGDVSNLILTDFTISYSTTFLTYAGGLCGYLSGNVTNVSVDGDISVTNSLSSSYVGLLCGVAQIFVDSTMTADEFVANYITQSQAMGTIDVSSQFFAYVGGLVGKAYNYEITSNVAASSINVTTQLYRAYVGGLIGHNYGGLLIGYEEYVDTTDINISENVVLTEIYVTSMGVHSSLGGLIGYSQYGILSNNFVVSSLSASGIDLYVGSLLGEDWYGTVDKAVVVSNYEITVEDNQVVRFTNSVGKAVGETLDETTFYSMVQANLDDMTSIGTDIDLTNLSDASWYTNTVGWTSDDFDFSLLISFLPE